MPLLAWYKLDEDALDSSGNGNHGTDHNSVGWIDGKIGQCGDFNGSTQYISAPQISEYLHGKPEASIALWCKKKSIQYGFLQLSGFTNTNGNLYPYQTDTRVYLDVFRTNRLGPIEMHSSVLEWHHVVITQSRIGGWNLYQNGELVYHAVANDTVSTDYLQFEIGRNSNNRYANALMDDVRVYDHALSVKEIKELSKAEVGRWTLNHDGSDISGYNNNATIVGATHTEDSKIGSGARYFNGSSDYAIIEKNFVNSPTQLTISSWFKKTGVGSNYNCVIHKGSDTSVGASEYWLGTDSVDNLVATIGARVSGIGWAGGQTSVKCAINTWYHLAATWDGSVVKVYVNGEYQKQYNLTSYGNLNTQTRFGASSNGGHYQFAGIINDVRIYTEALSDEGIKELYETRASLDDQGNLSVSNAKEYHNWNPEIENFNLLENGDQEYKDNYNFPGFTYVESGDYLSRTSGSSTVLTSNFIPIRGNGLDNWDRYRLEGEIKGEDHTSRYYYMIDCYDKNFHMISNQHVNARSGTATVLTQELKSGDEWVYLEDVSNWYDDGTTNYHHAKGLALWHPDDDPLYKPYVYSRRWLTIVEVDKINRRLRLQNTYSGSSIPSNSLAQNHQSGGTYSYIGASNVWTDLDRWDFRSADTSTTPDVGNVRYGTSYVKIGFLINRDATTGTPTTIVKNLRFYNLDSHQKMISEFHTPALDEKGVCITNDFSEVAVVNGIQAWYPLNGNANDRSGNQNHGTVNGATPTPGIEGLVYDFNTNSKIEPSETITLTGDLTVSYWFNPRSTSSYRLFNATDFRYAIWHDRSDRVGFDDRGQSGSMVYVNLSESVPTNSWTHLTVVREGNTVTVYVNGEESGSNSGWSERLELSIIGHKTNNTGWGSYEGKIGEIRLFNRALTPEEIGILYALTGGSNDKMKITKNKLYLKGEVKEV